MNEKRKQERYHLIHYLRIFNRDNRQEIGNLVNINSGGVMIVSGEPLELNKCYHLTMEFPEEFLGEHQLDFDAEVRWVKEDQRFGLIANGLHSVNISEKNLSILKYLINFYQDNEEL